MRTPVAEDRVRAGREREVQLGLLGEVAGELARLQQLLSAGISRDLPLLQVTLPSSATKQREVRVAVRAGAVDHEQVGGG